MPTNATIGSLMLDLIGVELSAEERELLQHPMTGGVILFTRNYEDKQQLTELVQQIRAASQQPLLIAVDHEGGRVQRFRPEFSRLPPLGEFGVIYQEQPEKALQLAEKAAWLMAIELRELAIDFSFAPVLDLDYGVSEVIGDRSFGRDPHVVVTLASAYIKGMKAAGMAATGKHFPGHGAVVADSHLAIPMDKRSEAEIWHDDIQPFIQLHQQGQLDAVMPAHVIYSQLDQQPAGFSPYWLQTILRQKIGFNGVIFSDDLSMEGASFAGGYTERAEAALAAGCDMILACNQRVGAIEILDQVRHKPTSEQSQRLQRMVGKPLYNQNAQLGREYWEQVVTEITALA
jgi:beta-N-acetylhexosaminidase